MTGAPRFSIRRNGFTSADFAAFAAIHASEVSGGFLTSLGPKALEEIYRHIAASRVCALIAAYVPERPEPVGFICGTLDCGLLYREFMLARGLRALPVFLPRLLSCKRLVRALETLLYPMKRHPVALPSAEIVNFAILPPYRGQGLARRLFDDLMGFFRAKGVRQVKIVTGAAQVGAQRFYEKAGARRVARVEVHSGRESLAYVFDLP